MGKKLNIAVISGGWSSERAISLLSGKAVCSTLDQSKYYIEMYDPKYDLSKLIKNKHDIDLAFILLHGKFGEDGCIQGLLNILDIQYVGSGVLSSATAVNKKITKKIYKNVGLTITEDFILKKENAFSIDAIIDLIGVKVVVKPLGEGSSIGMSLASNREELVTGIEEAFIYGPEIMIEKFIDGKEVTCCILGNNKLEALPVIEIVPNQEYRFFDYRAKYTNGATNEICPALISRSVEDDIKESAKRAHKALGCSVWSRTDMIIKDEKIYLLETNTVPGMTENSLFPLAAKTAGMSFSELLDILITMSFEKESLC